MVLDVELLIVRLLRPDLPLLGVCLNPVELFLVRDAIEVEPGSEPSVSEDLLQPLDISRLRALLYLQPPREVVEEELRQQR